MYVKNVTVEEPDTPLVLLEVRGDVAVITLNRPSHGNAWTVPLHVAYLAALARVETDPGIRAAVLTGAGRAFCVGADMSMLEGFQGGAEVPAELAQHTFTTALRVTKPLIAAVNGSAAGLGMAQTLMCDVRFASEHALFTTSFAKLGLVAENGVSWLLPQIVGRSLALDLLLSARRVNAEEALSIGLVDRLVPAAELLARAVEYAQGIARECSPASLAAMKEQVNRHAVASTEIAEEESRILVAEALAGADFAHGIDALVNKRPVDFAAAGAGTRFTSFADHPLS